MYSSEYCEIFRNSFFYKTTPSAAFGSQRMLLLNTRISKNVTAVDVFIKITNAINNRIILTKF